MRLTWCMMWQSGNWPCNQVAQRFDGSVMHQRQCNVAWQNEVPNGAPVGLSKTADQARHLFQMAHLEVRTTWLV